MVHLSLLSCQYFPGESRSLTNVSESGINVTAIRQIRRNYEGNATLHSRCSHRRDGSLVCNAYHFVCTQMLLGFFCPALLIGSHSSCQIKARKFPSITLIFKRPCLFYKLHQDNYTLLINYSCGFCMIKRGCWYFGNFLSPAAYAFYTLDSVPVFTHCFQDFMAYDIAVQFQFTNLQRAYFCNLKESSMTCIAIFKKHYCTGETRDL